MRGFQDRFARLGPQPVAGNCIDFAIVRQETEWLRKLPAARYWSALVINGQRRLKGYQLRSGVKTPAGFPASRDGCTRSRAGFSVGR